MRSVKIYKRENCKGTIWEDWLTSKIGRKEMVIVLGPHPNPPAVDEAKEERRIQRWLKKMRRESAKRAAS